LKNVRRRKGNIQSIVQFLENPSSSGYRRRELIDECADCLLIVQRRTAQEQSAAEALPVIKQVLADLRACRDTEALAGASRALEIIKDWFS
jgi:hypothetical protein